MYFIQKLYVVYDLALYVISHDEL